MRVSTPDGHYIVTGASYFCRRLLGTLHSLETKAGTDVRSLLWFFYESEREEHYHPIGGGPQTAHSFFVVHESEDRIVDTVTLIEGGDQDTFHPEVLISLQELGEIVVAIGRLS